MVFFVYGGETVRNSSTRNLTLSGLSLALGLLLPFLTAQIPSLGSRLLPMHLPALLCGLICGWQYGLVVGLITPVFRSLLFGMPPMFPTAVAMSFELAAYGLAAGYIYRLPSRKAASVYPALIAAMIIGRIVWGVASMLLFRLGGNAFTWKLFLGGALLNAIPGILLQLVLIPLIMFALARSSLIAGLTLGQGQPD